MTKVHAPKEPADTELWGPARNRLAYDEYLAGQLALLIVRSTAGRGARHLAAASPARSRRRSKAALPFALTAGQQMRHRQHSR